MRLMNIRDSMIVKSVMVHVLLSLGLRFNVSGDTQSLERRIIFENGNSQFSREINANINVQSCTTIRAYVQVCAQSLA